MKVAIIGGGGRVGSCAAYCLQLGKIVRELVLLDANQATAEGEALDLLHGSAYVADQVIRAGQYADCADADIVLITAGLRRKPDESRLDLINRNVTLFREILKSLKGAGLKKESIVFVVSNPVDILTQLALEETGLPAAQVLGLGTVLDTSRFCSLLASALQLPATQVRALILGEHGDTMVPIWSQATVDGLPLLKMPGVTPTFQQQLFERTQKSGAEVIARKGGAGWAVGVAINEVIESIALDRRRILPVSSLINGPYGVRDVCLSVPTVVGRKGVIKTLEIELWPKEMQGIQASAKALKETMAKVRGK
jgi:L-lactate dehydrogenase